MYKTFSISRSVNQPFCFWNINVGVFICILGIGQGRVTSNLQGAPIDDAVFVTDKEAVEMVSWEHLY